MDVNEVMLKLRNLKYNEPVVYHVGYLARDRGRNLFPTTAPDVHFLAGVASDLSDAGKVALVQRKLGFMEYQYIAVGLQKGLMVDA